MSKEKEVQVLTQDQRDFYKQRILQVGDGKVGRDIFHMLVGRYRLIYIRSFEEVRVLDLLKDICSYDGLELYTWNVANGLRDAFTEESLKPQGSEDTDVSMDPSSLLSYVIDEARADYQRRKESKNKKRGRVYVLLDFHYFLQPGNMMLERRFKEFSQTSCITSIIVVSPIYQCPIALDKEFALVDFPYPSRDEIKSSLDSLVELDLMQVYPNACQTANLYMDDIINASRGLTIAEAENAWSKSLARHRDFNIQTILDEKKQLIRKSGILEYIEPSVTFDDIGGLETLKEWLLVRKLGFSESAKKYGLPVNKGILIIGTPGTGKSLTCMALASAYDMPLLRLDMGAIYQSHVGESESNIRICLDIAGAIAPCVMFIDEVEKGVSGSKSSDYTDGGVSSRVFGTLLTWMSDEKEFPVFVACTANNIGGVPPEFLRAGRFDEIFWIDLPNEDQRYEVTSKLLQKKHRDPANFDIDAIVSVTEHYSPAEIEKGIDNALFVGFSDGEREITTDDVVSELGKFQCLYNGRRDEIEDMRAHCLGADGTGGLARLANGISKKTKTIRIKEIEL